MARALFVDATETDTLPLFDDGEYAITVKRQLTAGDDKHVTSCGIRRMGRQADADRDAPAAFDVDLGFAAFEKVATFLVDWNLKNADGKPMRIAGEREKREALRALRPDVFNEIERVVDAHAQKAQEKKVPGGSSVPATTS